MIKYLVIQKYTLKGLSTLTVQTVSCLGSGSGKPGDPYYDAMVDVGRLFAQRGVTVITGGFGGVGMEAPAKGAREGGGQAIGYTMRDKPSNKFVTNRIDCSMVGGEALGVELQYGVRLGRLLSSDAFVISAGGGPGTMTELMAIINFNTKIWTPRKPVAIVRLPDEIQYMAAWDAAMLFNLESWGVLSQEIRNSIISIVRYPDEAVDWVTAAR